jgi:UDP-N-acetyl-D-glucosamine dehydrogenase
MGDFIMKSSALPQFTTIEPASDLPSDIQDMVNAYATAKAVVGVVGLGYVGIPLVSTLSANGFEVIGFDVDEARVEGLKSGKSPIKHIPSSDIQKILDTGKFDVTADFTKLAKADAILICVPTQLTKQREPDLSFVVDTTRVIAKYLRKGQLIVLESTTYPGTTTEVMRPILEETGLKCGEDFFMAYSPEREDPGNEKFSAASIPKVVGGDGAAAIAMATTLYGKIVPQVVPVSSTETAEAVKLTENIFRAVNIALVNELKVIYSAMGIDVWEVINAAKTKPFGFMPFYPGPGLGGHCIPIDPFYLTWKAREYEISTRFIELAGEVNVNMPRYVVTNLAEALSVRAKKSLNGAKILLLGIAYKKNVDDLRESPSLRLWEIMEERGATVDFHVSYIPVVPKTREHMALAGRKGVELNAATLAQYDAVLIATDHDDVDYKMIVDNAKLVVDTRNACERAGLTGGNIVKS